MNALMERPGRRSTIADRQILVRVRESACARTVRLMLGPMRPLEIIVPAGMSDAEIDGVLSSKRQWIRQKLRVSEQIAARPHSLHLEQPGVAWVAGNAVDVVLDSTRRATAELRDGRLLVGGSQADAAAAIERFYRRRAREHAVKVAAGEADRLGMSFASLAVRDPKTRWGSCSANSNISVSWRLAIAPQAVFDYVIVHELCHLREPRHSRAFWQLVDAAAPGWREHAAWLREHGGELRAYRPKAIITGAQPLVRGA